MSIPQSTVHVHIHGNLGNRLMQFMTAQAIASRVPGCQISNISIPQFDLFFEELPNDGSYTISFTDTHESVTAGYVDVENIARLLKTGLPKRVKLSGYCQNFRNFDSPSAYAQFLSKPLSDVAGYGKNELLISLRMAEIANGDFPNYVLLPIEFYAEVISSTGLRPVFLGQIDDNAYCRELRKSFPEALFVHSKGIEHDFETIRRSKNILLSVSTFSWVAAWLSSADMIIMPIAGLFHPRQQLTSNLIPFDDPRFSYYLFPIYHACSLDHVLNNHGKISGLWRKIKEIHVAEMLNGPRFCPKKDDYVVVFDEEFYLCRYEDVRIGVERNGLPSGLTHYIQYGFDEGRSAFEINDQWYFGKYIIAAIEVGQGDYLDAAHHYAAIGAERGYTPMPVDDIHRPQNR